MALTTRLSLTFGTEDGTTTTMSFNYADPEVTTQLVNALMNGIITNGSIYQKVPLTKKTAKLIQTSTDEFDLS